MPADATSIAAVGTTDVTVSDDVLGFLGLTDEDDTNNIIPSPIGGATNDGATFSFSITGGTFDPLLIDHSGGVAFEFGTELDEDYRFLQAENFLIDGTTASVSADVSGSIFDGVALDVPIFDLDLESLVLGETITVDLLINEILSGALVATFLTDDTPPGALAGVTFGSASTSPTPVPLPASALLLLAGLGALSSVRRLKSQN